MNIFLAMFGAGAIGGLIGAALVIGFAFVMTMREEVENRKERGQ